MVGFPASGKGEFSRIAQEIGIPVVVMGDVIRRVAEERGLPPTDANLGGLAQSLREREGQDAIARRCIPLIEERDGRIVLVDGIRSDHEVMVFRNHFPDFLLVAIRASPLTRLRRLKERGRSDDARAGRELEERDRRERGWGLERAMEMADFIIENETDLDRFRGVARFLLEELSGDAR